MHGHSELVGLDVSDVVFVHRGMDVTLQRSKTDREAAGRKLGILPGIHPATCPVPAVPAWLHASAITDGPLFRAVGQRREGIAATRLCEKVVADVVKRAANAAGLDEGCARFEPASGRRVP